MTWPWPWSSHYFNNPVIIEIISLLNYIIIVISLFNYSIPLPRSIHYSSLHITSRLCHYWNDLIIKLYHVIIKVNSLHQSSHYFNNQVINQFISLSNCIMSLPVSSHYSSFLITWTIIIEMYDTMYIWPLLLLILSHFIYYARLYKLCGK